MSHHMSHHVKNHMSHHMSHHDREEARPSVSWGQLEGLHHMGSGEFCDVWAAHLRGGAAHYYSGGYSGHNTAVQRAGGGQGTRRHAHPLA